MADRYIRADKIAEAAKGLARTRIGLAGLADRLDDLESGLDVGAPKSPHPTSR